MPKKESLTYSECVDTLEAYKTLAYLQRTQNTYELVFHKTRWNISKRIYTKLVAEGYQYREQGANTND